MAWVSTVASVMINKVKYFDTFYINIKQVMICKVSSIMSWLFLSAFKIFCQQKQDYN